MLATDGATVVQAITTGRAAAGLAYRTDVTASVSFVDLSVDLRGRVPTIAVQLAGFDEPGGRGRLHRVPVHARGEAGSSPRSGSCRRLADRSRRGTESPAEGDLQLALDGFGPQHRRSVHDVVALDLDLDDVADVEPGGDRHEASSAVQAAIDHARRAPTARRTESRPTGRQGCERGASAAPRPASRAPRAASPGVGRTSMLMSRVRHIRAPYFAPHHRWIVSTG